MPGMQKTMHEFKEGNLHSGSKSGPVVTNPKQAVAIGLNQERKGYAEGGEVVMTYKIGPGGVVTGPVPKDLKDLVGPNTPDAPNQAAQTKEGAGASYAKGGLVKAPEPAGLAKLYRGEEPTPGRKAHSEPGAKPGYAQGGWIKSAIKHPGAERAAAAKAGESTHAYMEAHKGAPGVAGDRARLGLRLEGMNKAGGGPVDGPGTGTSDSVPINASNGEYVIRADVVNYLGAKFFDDLQAKVEAEMKGRNGPKNPFDDLAGQTPGDMTDMMG